MKKTIAILLVLQLVLPVMAQTTPAATQAPAQQAPAAAPATKKVIVQTPFGPKEYDVPVDTPPATPATVPVTTPVQTTVPPISQPTDATVAAQPTPQNPPTQTPQAADDIVPISLQFDNAQDIYGIIKIIMGTLNLNYYIDPAVKGSINIVTNGNLRRSDLLPILELILKINGATMVQNGNIWGIVPAASILHQTLEVQERMQPANPDDQFVMQIIRMKFVAAPEMANLLNPFLTEGANILVHAAGNVLIITERKNKLKQLLDLLDTFDTNVFEDQRVRLMPVRNNLARDLVSDLNSVFSGYGMSQSSTAIRFVAIEHLNSILVITPNATVFPEVEKWLTRLDETSFKAGIQTYVYKVKNSKASDIQGVLTQLYGGQFQVSSIYNQPSSNVPAASQAPAAAPNPMGQAPAAAPAANAVSNSQSAPMMMANGANDIRIIADIRNNYLVIQSTPQIYREIQRTIQELDVLPRQVLIDAQIYEVVLDASLQFGLSAILQNRGTLGPNPQTTASFVGSPPSLAAQTFAYIGRARELVLFLNASENRSRVRTLSAPSVMVSDNMRADFQVGAEVPIPTSSSVTPVQNQGTNLFAQTIQFRPTGVILGVKPQINDSGNVTLEIAQEVSQAGANTTSAVVAPVISKTSVNSTISIQDGETIALGGFIRENNDFAQSRIPLIGRIPVAGALFGNTLKTKTRSELIILITPHVLKSYSDADSATDELKAKLKEVQKLLK